MNDYTTYVGMDVHARSIMCKGMCKETGEIYARLFVDGPSSAEVHEWMASLPQPVYSAYESGCTGFWLARELREIMNPLSDCSTVWLPDVETEAARDLARARQDAVKAVKSAKQKVSSLLLRYHFVWNEKTPTGKLKKAWRGDYRKWLDKIALPDPSAQTALEHYKRAVKRAEEELAEMDGLVRARAEEPRWKPYVDALVHLKGVDVCSAFLACAEFGDFSRFASGRKVSCWVGTVPTNSSSGPRESHGGITKAGSTHLRMGLVEGCCGIDRWRAADKAVKGHPASAEVLAIAGKANERLRKRYRHLRDDLGKTPNKARVAVVSELARWIWVIGLQVQAEQAV